MMDNNIKSSAELRSSKFRNKESDRRSSVDIKEICQKFENLSSVVESSRNVSENFTPVVPARRKRNKINGADSKPSGIIHENSKCSQSIGSSSSEENCNVYPSSVKERTKLFESPTPSDKPFTNTSSSKLIKSNNTNFSPQSKHRISSTDAVSKKLEKFGTSDKALPPAKPPRSFVHSSTNVDVNGKIEKQIYSSPVSIKKSYLSKSEIKVKNTSSLNIERKIGEVIPKNSRLGSAPEVKFINSSKSPLSTPKSAKSSGKTLFLLDRLKTISSTASNICEKVKHSNIFVDLTPTTVSPPKHYGTLKRSLSEEHIYAEPASIIQSDIDKSKSPKAEPLHYMCTSLVPPALPNRPNSEENRSLSKFSVRNMIYDSFASLRAPSKENSENTSNTPASDNCDTDISLKAIQDRIIYVKSVRKQVSSSSICLAPKLYEALFIVNIVENQPQATYSFPLKVDAEYNIPLLPHICFPDHSLLKSVSVYHSEVFYFSLVDKNENIFGYCLRIQGWPEGGLDKEPLCVKLPVAVCILSTFSAPVFYKKILLEIEKHLTLPRNKCFKYIRSLRKLGVPNAGASLSIPDVSEQEDESKRTVISRPLDSHFVGLEMTRTLQLLDVDILVKCVASLFLERRILFFSASTSNLYHCCKAISSLLYPFEWPHLIVPVLPACLTIHCCSEQPYVLGIVNNNCDSVLELLAEHELLIIDVDKGTIIKSCNDEDTILPKKVQKAVISALNLAKNMTDPTEMLRDIMISEAFVHMSVEMIGHYENHFVEVNGNTAFQKEAFLKNAFSHNIRSFLQWFSETQMFDSFIEASLWRIKYRNICQTTQRTFFEKRVDEYKWELTHDGEKLSRIIGKTVKNFGEMLKGLKKC